MAIIRGSFNNFTAEFAALLVCFHHPNPQADIDKRIRCLNSVEFNYYFLNRP